jgi:RNA polymerase sigma-70 factor (ECF subfamily)
MSGYQRGDPVATSVLIRQVSPLLLRFFASQCGSRPYAEDLLQDTWLQIHKVRHTHRPGEPVLPWIYAIARHVRVDGYRRSQRIRLREQIMSPLPEPPVSARPFPGADFDELIAALPPSQREVVSMLKVSGMSLAEVARATASSVGSVKLKAHRAYEKLRDILKRRGSESTLRSGDDVV